MVVFYFSFTAYLTPRRPRRPVSVVGRPRTPSHRSSLDSVVFHWFSVSKGGGVTAVGPVCRRRGRGHRPGIPRYCDFGDERQRDRERERERERNWHETKEQRKKKNMLWKQSRSDSSALASASHRKGKRSGVAASPLRCGLCRRVKSLPRWFPFFEGFFKGFSRFFGRP